MTPRHPTAIRIEVEKAFDDSNLIDYACAEIERLERALSEVQRRADDAQAAESIAQLAIERALRDVRGSARAVGIVGAEEMPIEGAAEALRELAASYREDYQESVAALKRVTGECGRLREYAVPLERIAELVWQCGDMMRDGPDDSDMAMANGWLLEAFDLACELRRAKGGPLAVLNRLPEGECRTPGEKPSEQAVAPGSQPEGGSVAQGVTAGETAPYSEPFDSSGGPIGASVAAQVRNEIFHSKQERLEAVARRICEADGGDPDEDTMTCSAMPTPNGPRWLGYLPHAAAVLDMLDGVSRHQVGRDS